MKTQTQNVQQTIDSQLVEWRRKSNTEIPERVGLAFYTNEKGETDIDFYNLDMVISVGYRVNSHKATQFRKFATRVLHEYIQNR